MSLLAPLSVAPMIDWSNTHFRYLMRLIAPHSLLYTEMQTIGAVMNNPKKALNYHPCEHPIALQLGGADPKLLSLCAKIAEDYGFDEINLNFGCPSDRVQAGHFGACLMAEQELAAECITQIKKNVRIPVTAKTRIGIDHQDSFDFFYDFAHHLIQAGCDKIIVHARKAWLKGLNPKQNRTIPPVHYDYVYQLKQRFPSVPMVINGNISTLEEIHSHMQKVDGVMLGRLACNNPYALREIQQSLTADTVQSTRSSIFNQYLTYLQSQGEIPLSILIKPILNFAHGMPGNRLWKQWLEKARQTKDLSFLNQALSWLRDFDSEDLSHS